MLTPFLITTILVTLAVIVWGIASWALNPAVQQHLIKLAPQSPQVVLALNSSFLFLGISGGAAMGGLILQYITLPNLGWASSATQLISLMLVLLSTRLVRDKAASMVKQEQ